MMTRWTFQRALALSALLSAPLAAGPLDPLLQEYKAAKGKARGGEPGKRLERARTQLKPILVRIAGLGTPEAVGFLLSEIDKESPEIAAVCVEPVLSTANPRVPEALLGGFAKRAVVVRQEIVLKLAAGKHDLSALEAPILGLLQTETHPEVRKELPALSVKLGTAAAAKALVLSLGARGGAARGAKPRSDGSEEYERRVVAALKETKDEAVREWLAGPAFQGAPPERIEALAGLAGELKLEAARAELEKAVDSADEKTAVACLAALVKIGPGPSAARISESLKKGKRSLAFRIQALDALAASGGEEAVAAVRESAKHQDADTRSVALGSLARVPGSNPAALAGILQGLKDPEPSVRSASVRALRNIRHKPMVPALIDLLAGEKEDKLRVDVLQLLIHLTGKNMGLVAEDWQKWWDVSEPKFEFAKEGAAGLTATKAHDLKYFGIEVSSKRLGFLLDASGSMLELVDVYGSLDEPRKRDKDSEPGKTRARPGAEEGKGEGKGGEVGAEKKRGPKSKARKIDVLKKEMARVVSELPRDTQINIVTFNAAFKAWQESLQPLAGGGREKALGFVKDIGTGQGTNVFDTLEFALRDKRVDTIFLLTDGLPTRGRFTDKASILREVRTLNRARGITINCIAFGEESDFLKDLAKENGGVYRFVNSY